MQRKLKPYDLSLLKQKNAERPDKDSILITRHRHLKKLKGIYFFTVFLIIILSITILVTEFGAAWLDRASNLGVRNLVTYVSSSLFQNLSGKPMSNTDSEKSDVTTSPPADLPAGPGSIISPPAQNQESLYDFDASKVPLGETPILPMDLSLINYGPLYIQNATGYTPDLSTLLQKDLFEDNSFEYLSSASDDPMVLILHTHGTESYLKDGAISYRETGGELARSEDVTQNVVAIGKILCETLNSLGVPSIQCEILHDRIQYKDSYARAEETIRSYLERYPGIRLVIDLHRDAIIKAEGEIVRPITMANGKKAAQVMCVVGSSWGGQVCPNWENNLALALQLRERLNDTHQNLCRPVSLRASTYNQEIAAASLLLEIGAVGNSLEEAGAAAECVGKEIAALLLKK